MLDNYKFTDAERKELIKSISILVDTREKANSHILNVFDKKGINYINKALAQGDYSFYIPKNEKLNIPRDLYFNNEIMIERKANLEELSNNFSNCRDRFEKEFSLFKGKKHLLIENNYYSDIVNGNYDTKYNKESYIGTLHSFQNRYGIYTWFINSNDSAGFIYRVFKYFLMQKLV